MQFKCVNCENQGICRKDDSQTVQLDSFNEKECYCIETGFIFTKKSVNWED